MKNVLLIGSGGREHALAWKLAQSPQLGKLFVAPGNAGIADCAELVTLDIDNHDAVIDFCRLMAIDLVIVGPEGPLVDGISDALTKAGLQVFGPSQAAAELEGSKAFTKEICRAANIPTAAYQVFDQREAALNYLHKIGVPIVIKADGLAAGKGVTVATELAQAEAAIEACFAGAFGASGHLVVIEEMLVGHEVSFFALCDGQTVLPLTSAQDHKRVGEGDTGPNTGGMGAYSPTPLVDAAAEAEIVARIIQPTVDELNRRGTPFSGVLFAGLMMTDRGPSLIEYNVRFGDPECQVLMIRLQGDLLALLEATATGTLASADISWNADPAINIVMAAAGYPGDYKRDDVIGLPDLSGNNDSVIIFHAGTRQVGAELRSNGGRVLNVTATGQDYAQASQRAYDTVDKIDWPNGFCRRDIGWQVLR
jgi:phosphoribosylamine--glycine ligase